MGVLYNSRIVTDGLVLCLDAGDKMSYPGAGTTWYDLSKNSIHATLTNGPTFNSSDGGSIVFDGTNDYVNIPGNGDVMSNLTVYTVELIIKTSYYGNKVILEKGSNAKMSVQPPSAGFGGANATFYGDRTNFTDSSPIWNGNWLNVTFVQASTYRKLYLNNILKDTQSLGNDPANSNDIHLMSRGGSYSQPGNVSILKIYDKVLSEQEIKQNYNATKGRFGL